MPTEALRPYIRHMAISESAEAGSYKVFPSTGMVIGFQYRGRMSVVEGGVGNALSTSGITGLAGGYKVFGNADNTGSILVYFTEVGFAHFSSCPANELFDLSVSLRDIFDKRTVIDTEERLSLASTDGQRVAIVERFLLARLRTVEQDKLVMEAVRRIYAAGGVVKIAELAAGLYISQSPLEKRFRRLVGATPKKFASIVRFNAVLNKMDGATSLVDICYENNFFDQSHFIRDFKRYTGDTPENFRR